MPKSNDKEFNETLQRMLKTPPSHHEDEKKGEKKPPKKKKAAKKTSATGRPARPKQSKP